MNEHDIYCLLEVYERHLGIIRKHEGRSFEKVLLSYKICLHMIKIVITVFLYGAEPIFGIIELPEKLRNLV